MALEHRLEVKMLQKLILTPQLQQAIKLLQMPQLELSMTLTNELVENPFLEEATYDSDFEEEGEGSVPQSDEPPVSAEAGAPEPGESAEDFEGLPEAADFDLSGTFGTRDFMEGFGRENDAPTPPVDLLEGESFEASEEAEAPLERLMGFGADEYFDSRSYDGRDLGYFNPDNNPNQPTEQYVSNDSDLYEHLNWQLKLSTVSEEIRAAAEAVIGNIDERGYLGVSVEEIAEYVNCPLEVACEAVRLVQGFDPAGIGARNLKECLIMQLNQLGLRGTLVENLILNNLHDIERKRYPQMALQYGCPLEDIKQAIKVIEGLEPKPGSSLSSAQTIYIKPDVYVLRDDANFRIVLNDENIPTLRINGYYRRILAQRSALNKEEREYLTERLRSAVWLLKSLDHRNKTLYRVTDSIVKFQYDFFDKNVSYMKPLNLRDVAEELGMHESTISRATSNKYLACSHGLFSFRFFFSSGLQGAEGEVSSNYVKDMIKKIVEEEDEAKPLSDQKISDLLGKSNITVARRTVAKYREELNIPSQGQRRKRG